MGEIHNILEAQPHLQGEALCLHCNYVWQAVAPVGTLYLQCPTCELHKGVFNYLVFPESYWQCKCGYSAFSVSGETSNIICLHCGDVQVFPD